MIWPHWLRRRELDQRVTDAREDADRARRDLEQAREQVIRPLAAAGERNHFAEVIRASLLQGGHR